jgi:hypothetical protein
VWLVVDVVTAELDRVHERTGDRFPRAESRARAREYVSGLVRVGTQERVGCGYSIPVADLAFPVCLRRASVLVDQTAEDFLAPEPALPRSWELPPRPVVVVVGLDPDEGDAGGSAVCTQRVSAAGGVRWR